MGTRKVIYKYHFSHIVNYLELPTGYKIIHVGRDPHGNACIWVEIDPDERTKVYRNYHVIGTGQIFAESLTLTHVGSYIDGVYIWHVYEEVTNEQQN